jgi:hypothetical protein
MTQSEFPWPQYVAKVRDRGALGMQLYVVLTSPVDGMEPVMANIQEHLAYQKKLEADGIMFGAGPFADDAEEFWQGEGMVIIRAASLKEAHAIAAADPMHQSGARNFRVRPWLLNEGSLQVRLTYSDGGREIG